MPWDPVDPIKGFIAAYPLSAVAGSGAGRLRARRHHLLQGSIVVAGAAGFTSAGKRDISLLSFCPWLRPRRHKMNSIPLSIPMPVQLSTAISLILDSGRGLACDSDSGNSPYSNSDSNLGLNLHFNPRLDFQFYISSCVHFEPVTGGGFDLDEDLANARRIKIKFGLCYSG
ncbi:hypothetical protein EVAR_82743_1 [Eumeta japonica]|uniref:Uncharacterized protein n=1 Tax=Eumeta variegata TaxID=151549 RepID=A0A4C2A1X6_EUMVA|nr:hypothetical protein EVAR_82743_1 [Eumeta japonica]